MEEMAEQMKEVPIYAPPVDIPTPRSYLPNGGR